MTELWLIRHGQTDWNLEKRYQGQVDIPLNQTGIQQARELSASLPQVKFEAIFSSDLTRAKTTAEILAEKLGLTVQVDARLREIFQGEWEGQYVSRIRALYNNLSDEAFKLTQITPPGGETVMQLAERVSAAIGDITIRYPEGKVLVVAHGLALATLICQSKGIALSEAYFQIPRNARETILYWDAQRMKIAERDV